jgi:DNA-binding transcriptional LysR family regulator
MDLNRADLSLLMSLDAVLAERNVSRAAARLGVTQPALSAQLARLREMFGDPLLIATARGMVPTPRAEALQDPLHDALERLRGLICQELPFDPATASNTLRIAASDFIHRVLILPEVLTRAAPNMRVVLLTFDPQRAWQQIENGEVDLLIAAEHLTPKAARARRLFQEDLVFIQRPGHPRGTGRVTVDEFCALDHVQASPEGDSSDTAMDEVLAAQGRSRRIAVSVPSFLLVPSLVMRTDLVALVPRCLALNFPDALAMYAPPLAVPGYAILASWHQRRQMDAAHVWLRERVRAAVAEVRANIGAEDSEPVGLHEEETT